MRYVSTRGRAPELDFADVLLAGLADDGGLYVPVEWPKLPALPAAGRPYHEVAAAVMAPFVGSSLGDGVLERLCDEAYATFRHPAVCPLTQLDSNEWLLELFHGPTLAFKDVALQLVGRMFDHVLGERQQRVTIVGATSGDTGSAAIDGVKSCEHVDIVILYPYGRVSQVQRRQMTTVEGANVHAVAVDGTFDDCQDLVKAMFADVAFRNELSLSAVNSINWARVMAQIVYYVTTWQALGEQPLRYVVPTGNFGNILAGWVAGQMGLPIEGLVVASNSNDILTRWMTTGSMTAAGVVPTLSPSMDIQVSSNTERLLFELNGRDGGLTDEQLTNFRRSGRLVMEPDQMSTLHSNFSAGRLDDAGTSAVIADVYRSTGQLIDPHTAVGIGVGRSVGSTSDAPTVYAATAHAAKFPDAVEAATGVHPGLPAHLADLFERPERTTLVANDLTAVEDLVRRLVR